MRLFIGIPLSKDIKDEFGQETTKLSNQYPNLNFTPPDNYHITTLFIGELEKINGIEQRLKKVIENEPAFEVNLKGAGAFPNILNPRVLWVGAENKNLTRLIKKIRKEFKDLNTQDNHKEIIPHITFARVRCFIDREQIIKLVSHFKKHNFGTMLVDRFVLYESVISDRGTIYRKIFEVKLKSRNCKKTISGFQN